MTGTDGRRPPFFPQGLEESAAPIGTLRDEIFADLHRTGLSDRTAAGF